MYGGSFMSGVKHIYSKAQNLKKYKPYAQKAVSFGKAIAPAIETIAPRSKPILDKGLDVASNLLGMGYTKAQIRKMMNDYSPKDLKKMVSGSIVGGKGVSKNKLRQRMMDYDY